MFGYSFSPFSGAPSVAYTREAQLLFDAVDGFPEAAKPFYNSLIKGFQNVGAWSESGFRCIACVPGDNHDDYLIDLKSLTKVAKYQKPGDITGLRETANARGSQKGYLFSGTNSHIDTGYIPSDLQGTNSACTILVTYQDQSSANTILSGAYDGSQSNILAPERLGEFWGDAWSLTTGRIKYTSATGEAGVYMVNVKASNDIDLIVNGTVVKTGTAVDGTPPTVSTFLNTYNNNGSPSTRNNRTPICLYAVLESGLSDAEAVDLSTTISAWQTSMQMIDTTSYDKLLVLDGNSLCVVQFSKFCRNLETGLFASNWDIQNYGVAGQTLTQMESDAASQIDTLYDAGKSKNILIVKEAVNEFRLNGYAGLQGAMSTYVSNRQAAGFTVAVCHMSASGSGGNVDSYDQETFDLKTDEFNVWLDGGGSGADYVITAPEEFFVYRSAYASDAAYTAAMTALRDNATYYADSTHFTEAGAHLWKDNLITAVNSL